MQFFFSKIKFKMLLSDTRVYKSKHIDHNLYFCIFVTLDISSAQDVLWNIQIEEWFWIIRLFLQLVKIKSPEKMEYI